MRLRRYDRVNPSKSLRRDFDCGHPSLNDWLAKQARQSMATRDAVTQLLIDDDTIAGYFCLSAGSLSRELAPASIARGAPDPIPMVKMGRFAIDRRYQGQGWGADLLNEAIRSAAGSQEQIGARALLVDAIDDSAYRFYLRFGFLDSPVAPMQLCLPLSAAIVAIARSEAAGTDRMS